MHCREKDTVYQAHCSKAWEIVEKKAHYNFGESSTFNLFIFWIQTSQPFSACTRIATLYTRYLCLNCSSRTSRCSCQTNGSPCYTTSNYLTSLVSATEINFQERKLLVGLVRIKQRKRSRQIVIRCCRENTTILLDSKKIKRRRRSEGTTDEAAIRRCEACAKIWAC